MNNINFRELKEDITPEQIKKILLKYDVSPHYENDKIIIYPTVCHNLCGGSYKLYYYKNTKLFKCFTECDSAFDIFELVQKMEQLRGRNVNIFDTLDICDVEYKSFLTNEEYSSVEDINYLYNLLKTKQMKIELPKLDENIMNRFSFNTNVLNIWVKEGISFDTMKKFGISYDPIENCIIIPNYDIDNNLISIRGRFLNEDAEAKYKPIIYGSKVLSHPSSASLYGINITKDRIKKSKMAIIFESEKSVLMMETAYGDKNCSVATLGKNISSQQIQILSDLDVKEVVLAYDADYKNYSELKQKQKEYFKIANVLKPYFNVCVLFDFDCNLLRYKDSPIDRGKEIFEKILNNRVYV